MDNEIVKRMVEFCQLEVRRLEPNAGDLMVFRVPDKYLARDEIIAMVNEVSGACDVRVLLISNSVGISHIAPEAIGRIYDIDEDIVKKHFRRPGHDDTGFSVRDEDV